VVSLIRRYQTRSFRASIAICQMAQWSFSVAVFIRRHELAYRKRQADQGEGEQEGGAEHADDSTGHGLSLSVSHLPNLV
jgi:hypothetical protein